MDGNKQSAVILQPRDRKIFRMLSIVRVATQAQLAQTCGFNSRTRANARLLRLLRSGHLTRVYIGTIAGGRLPVYKLPQTKIVAYRGPAGLEAALCHQLAVTDVYTAAERAFHASTPSIAARWVIRRTLGSPAPVPDAEVHIATSGETVAHLIETDLDTEGKAVWQQKVDAYIALAQAHDLGSRIEARRFSVLVVAPSEHRISALRSIVRAKTDKLFWFTTFESLTSEGFLAPIWQRPTGDAKVSLQ